MLDPEDLDFVNDSIGQALEEFTVPPEGLDFMNINDYIAAMSVIVATSEAIGGNFKPFRNKLGIYAHMRDQQGAQTYGDVIGILSNGQVDPNIVDLWIEEEFFAFDPREFDAIAKGYPDKTQKLQEARDNIDNI